MAGTAADIDCSTGGTAKKVYINYPNTTIVGINATYLYVCNAGTGNGTTASSAGVTLDITVEYVGND